MFAHNGVKIIGQDIQFERQVEIRRTKKKSVELAKEAKSSTHFQVLRNNVPQPRNPVLIFSLDLYLG